MKISSEDWAPIYLSKSFCDELNEPFEFVYELFDGFRSIYHCFRRKNPLVEVWVKIVRLQEESDELGVFQLNTQFCHKLLKVAVCSEFDTPFRPHNFDDLGCRTP